MNYYEILGIRKNSSKDEIKKAYRVLARKYHPDVSEDDDASSEAFLRIHQAYQVLSDPDTRQQYDREIQQTVPPTWKSYAQWQGRRPSSLFEWLSHEQFLQIGVFKERRRVSVEILLTPEEARLGGTVALTPCIEIPCPTCHGICQHLPLECLECYDTGVITQKLRLIHRIPPGVYDGMIEYISLQPFGFSGGEIEILYTVSYEFFIE
jgi:molecular chaperone DnaJ